MIHWLEHLTGLDNGSGHWYLWWSGFAGIIPEFALLGVVYRRLNCHVTGCHRLGLHHVEGTPFLTCKTHHPSIDGKVSAAHIERAHTRWKDR